MLNLLLLDLLDVINNSNQQGSYKDVWQSCYGFGKQLVVVSNDASYYGTQVVSYIVSGNTPQVNESTW